MKCPNCSSTKTDTYRHPNAKIWCTECGFVIREEGVKETPIVSDDPVVVNKVKKIAIVGNNLTASMITALINALNKRP
jgi:transcription initiation factor TFIIIB Brf1 subunit/transcription initiation factor TFIIB